jgi:hypothetical protein
VADPTLSQGQYSIGKEGSASAFVFGRGANSIQISNTATDTGTTADQDQTVTGHDGQLFGVDTLPGMVITQTGFAYTSPALTGSAMDAYSQLAGNWTDPSVRLADGAVQVLRAFYPGSSAVHRSYGRGRKIQPVYGQVYQGVVPFTSQFQSADNIWYSDTLYTLNLTQRPSFKGTITPPVTPPYQLAATTNFQQNTVINTGSLPTWPVITFTGPISFPGFAFVNTPVIIGYGGILSQFDTLVIDTRPWVRTAILNGSTSVAGLLTGNPMIGLQVQPGATTVRFTGQDFTGQAQVTVSWRNAFLAIGGTS